MTVYRPSLCVWLRARGLHRQGQVCHLPAAKRGRLRQEPGGRQDTAFGDDSRAGIHSDPDPDPDPDPCITIQVLQKLLWSSVTSSTGLTPRSMEKVASDLQLQMKEEIKASLRLQELAWVPLA